MDTRWDDVDRRMSRGKIMISFYGITVYVGTDQGPSGT